MPKALDVNWDVIRVEFAHGVKLEDLATKYGIKFGTLAARSSREGWMQTRPETHANPLHSALTEGAKTQGMSLQEAGQAYAARMFKKVSALAEAANLPAPRSYKDLELADKVARRAAGLENVETQVNTIIGVGAGFVDPSFDVPTEVEVVSNPSPSEGDSLEGSG